MTKKAIGIDIGGTGIKGALVDLRSGEIIGKRFRYETPAGGHPADVAAVVAQIVKELKVNVRQVPVGICFPAVVRHGITLSAANVSQDWIGFDAEGLFSKTLGRTVHVINDADAAGVAEIKFGAGKGKSGVVIMTTLGTGIGTAIFNDGILLPNAELGHLEIDGVDYETKASFAAKERENLSWAQWAARLQVYYSTLDKLFSPDLIIIGGGVSKQHEEFIPLLDLNADVQPALKRNNAGILGAASLAWKYRPEPKLTK
jgi:polyphosphate glucokinase